MTTVAKVISITQGKTADELVSEARGARQAASLLARKQEDVLTLEREAARLATTMVKTGVVMKRPRTRWTWPLVLLAGVAVWAAATNGPGYASTTKAVALAVSLAMAMVAVSGWRWNPYPVLWPALIVMSAVLLVLGTVVIVIGGGDLAGLAWFVVVGALSTVRLRHSWSAVTLARHGLRYQALQAEIAVLKASLTANSGALGGLS